MITALARPAAAVAALAAVLGGALPAAGAPRRHTGYGACSPYAAISSAPGLATTYFYKHFTATAPAAPTVTCTLEVPVTEYPGDFDGDVTIAASAGGRLALGPGGTATVTIESGMRGTALVRHSETLTAAAGDPWSVSSTTPHRLPAGANLTFVIRTTVTLTGVAGSVSVTSLSASGTDVSPGGRRR
ncbi:hypothetical protein [Pilimelia anulata]|nr:hypothetical protein [Pilimelia anulata]